MPEGDTLHTIAAALRPLLVGRGLRAVEVARRACPALVGRAVTEVGAVGKHLLVAAGDRTVRVHLGMDGSFHRYRPGERWQRSPAGAGLVLATDELVVVCFRPSAVEVLRTRGRAASPALARLGPDLVAPDADLAEVLRRARGPQHADRGVAELLLDQSVAAGIGNVYKSEVCFLLGVDPWTSVRALPDATLRGLYERAAALLRANVGPGPRTTTADGRRGDGRLWVYRRVGRPCRRCGAAIRAESQGRPTPRRTYWCPRCQGPPRP
jgi:endonuclease-8